MNFMAKVETASLHRLVYNAKLFMVGKNANPAYLYFENNRMEIEVDDRHTYIHDISMAALTGDGPFRLQVTSEVIKDWELILRNSLDDESPVEVGWDAIREEITLDGEESHAVASPSHPLHDMLDSGQHNVPSWRDYEMKPGTLRKLELIKPGDYPLSFRPVDHMKYGRTLLFKAGPTVSGGISMLDRDTLRNDSSARLWMW